MPYFKPLRLELRKVTPAHIQKYVNNKLKKNIYPNTVLKHIWIFSGCFKFAIQQNFINANPVDKIVKPKKIKYTGAKYLTKEQMDAVLDVFRGDILENVVLLTMFYGLRRSEVMGLKWDAVDFHNRTITIKHTVLDIWGKRYHQNSTKNASSYRTVPMPTKIEERLKHIRSQQERDRQLQPNDYKETGYVFTKLDGSLILPSYVTAHFRKMLISSGLPLVRFHDLRHSAASYLLHLGFNMKEIQVWLGHGDIGTTMNIYGHLDVSMKKDMAETLNQRFELLSTN